MWANSVRWQKSCKQSAVLFVTPPLCKTTGVWKCTTYLSVHFSWVKLSTPVPHVSVCMCKYMHVHAYVHVQHVGVCTILSLPPSLSPLLPLYRQACFPAPGEVDAILNNFTRTHTQRLFLTLLLLAVGISAFNVHWAVYMSSYCYMIVLDVHILTCSQK